MPSNKERYQNPIIGDTLKLRAFFYNLNNHTDVFSINKISIYKFDEFSKTPDNIEGKVLVKELDVEDVVRDSVGQYHIDVALDQAFTIGTFCDVWSVSLLENDATEWVNNYYFQVYPNLIYSTSGPIVYDFKFKFQPNRMRKGSKQFIRIQILPNVPTATDLEKYYENIAIVSNLSISIEQSCGPCVPEEHDLRMIVEEDEVTYREKCFGYYQIDTSDMEVGIYHIWFTLNLGTNTYVSEKMAFQIF